MDYRLILYGKQVYQEVPLSEKESRSVLIGTGKECTVRFNRSAFFDEFQISLVQTEGQWYLACVQNVFLMADNALKQYARRLEYGDSLSLYYEGSGVKFLQMELLMDFEKDWREYTQFLNLTDRYQFSVGGRGDCTVVITDPLFSEDIVSLQRDSKGKWCGSISGKYGLYVNGFRCPQRDAVIEDGDFFSVGQCQFYVSGERLYFGSDGPLYSTVPVYPIHNTSNHLKYPKFRRSTREQYVMPEERPEIQAVKQTGKPPKKNLLLTIAPAVISLILMILLRGVMGGGGIFVLYGGCMMAVGAIMSVINYRNRGKEYLEEQAKREQVYRQYIEEKEQEIVRVREKERNVRRVKYLSLEEDMELVRRFDRRLFERRKEDDDYLEVYLGQGELESCCQVKYSSPEQKDTEDPLAELPGQIAERYRMLTDVPVTVDLGSVNAVGLTGTRAKLYEMVKQFSLDLAVRQFYQDVKLFYLLSEEDVEQFSWLRWLRNLQGGGRRNLFYDEESRKNGLERIYNELSLRDGCSEEELSSMPSLVIFVYRSESFLTHPVSKYVQRAKRLGVVFLFFEEYRELLPLGCDQLIELSGHELSGTLRDSCNAEKSSLFTYTYLSDSEAEWAARRLGCVYIDEVNLEGNLASNISLFSMLGILHASDLDLSSQWNTAHVYETMAAPLGIKSGDEIVYLDLHEKAHGPHGLVAGTTGSGKSEILQTYILSMALRFHPYDVSFVIIDFKGGGMVNQFRKLPHLIGAITNIDGREIDRSLKSIRAELQKRQELFAEFEVNHIDAYIKKFKSGEAKIALPHLILIVDEFAELKTDQPDFMKELISTARIGRSLGIHLILATQKPSGVVDNQIWSNSRFRLCLKVQNREDSNEVLKSPLAAEIREPGRAYLQVGNNEIFQLFQSAYSGAAVSSDSLGRQRKYKVCTVDMAGRRTVIYEEGSRTGEESQTQLESVVEYIYEHCQKESIERLPDICMAPLPEMLECPEVPLWKAGSAIGKAKLAVQADIGLLDDPEQQRQEAAEIVFTQQNVFILGASGYGKTNLVQCIVKQLAGRYSPEQVQIYIMDFATMVLKSMEGLRHVGGVVTAYEDEKLKNLIKMLTEEMELRKKKLSRLGLSSFYAYLEGGYQGMPQIILILENLTGFRELYPQYDELFLRLCREGSSSGISVVVTNSQSSGVSYRYYSNFSKRIALYCNNSNEYYSMFDRCRMEPKNIPGRALLEVDRKIYECQIYLAFQGEREVERIRKVQEFLEQVNKKYPASRAKRIPEIPQTVTEDYMQGRVLPGERKPYHIPVGLNYASTEVEWWNPAAGGILGICSTRGLGRRNYVRYLLRMLERFHGQEPVECYILDNMDRSFGAWKNSPMTREYSFDPEKVKDWLTELTERLEQRYQKMLTDGNLATEPLLLLILHGKDYIPAVSGDKTAMERFRKLCGRYKPLKICILLTDVENSSISYSAPEVMKVLKENRNYLLFEDLAEQKICDLPLAKIKEFKKPLEAGDAYRIQGNGIIKLKTVLCKEGAESEDEI